MLEDEDIFYGNFHMDVETFETLFRRLENHLMPKRHTRPIDGIPPKHRLALALE